MARGFLHFPGDSERGTEQLVPATDFIHLRRAFASIPGTLRQRKIQ